MSASQPVVSTGFDRFELHPDLARGISAAGFTDPRPIQAETIFQEGIRIPPTKLYKKGVLQSDLLELILHNVRTPQWNRFDLNALVAACNTAAKRCIERGAPPFPLDLDLAGSQSVVIRAGDGGDDARGDLLLLSHRGPH